MRKFRDDPLAREITVVLAVKLFLIFGLWYAFFSHPIERQLTDRRVSVVILGQNARAAPAR